MIARSSSLRIARCALAGLATLAACHAPRDTDAGAAALGADTLTIRRDVSYLASDALAGRGTGSAGIDSAAAYIARRFGAIGLQPGGEHGFLQRFVARSAQDAHAGVTTGRPTQNVVGILRGADPALRDEYLVIGAHYDHLGRGSNGALDPEVRDAIRNGADDNASGTSAVMELARLLARRPPRRSIIFATFSGEELGLLGSQYFVEHSPVPLDRVVAMLNFDMVGRLRDGRLIVYGVETATEMRRLVDSANVAPPLALRAVGDGFGPSDHSSFYAKGIPVLHFFTDLHEDYHRATDDAEKVSVAGAARVIEYAERVARAIADRPARLTAVRTAAPSPVAAGRPSNVYLGSIPDMSASDVPGVRLTGVRAGSPADRAGLRAGDVIVEFGGRPVKDLYEYTDALRSRKPGDTVDIVILRDGSRQTVTATLGARGG